jgi:hypothetical protein
MTTSGNTILALTRNDIIDSAMRKIGEIADGQTPTTGDYTIAAAALNTVIGYLRTKGMQLWARKEYTFNPVLNTQTYQIGIGKTFNTPYPLHVYDMYRTDSGANNSLRVEFEEASEFSMLPLSSGGSPIKFTYQPFVNYGEIKLWPTPDANSTTATLKLVYQRPFEYFSSSTDTIDLPEEWYLPLIMQLTMVLCLEFSVALPVQQNIQKLATMYTEEVAEFGNEDGSLFIVPRRY